MLKSITVLAALSISVVAFTAPAAASSCSAAASEQTTQLAQRQTRQQAQQKAPQNVGFAAETFGFGVEREMKESGEKGGTEDINIGVGELQECTISKSMD